MLTRILWGDRHRWPRGSEDDRRLRVDDHAADRVALHRRPDAARHPRPAERLPRRAASRAPGLDPRAAGARHQAACRRAARPRRRRRRSGGWFAAQRVPLRLRRSGRGRAPAPRAAGATGRLASPRLPGRLGDLAQRPLRARARGLRQSDRQPRLGQARRSRSSSPTPTSRWPTCAAADRPRTRYWNTGSWIYEPDLSSRQAYARYLRYAWPGTAIVIDDEEPEPRLLELLADLNPLAGGPACPSSR